MTADDDVELIVVGEPASGESPCAGSVEILEEAGPVGSYEETLLREDEPMSGVQRTVLIVVGALLALGVGYLVWFWLA